MPTTGADRLFASQSNVTLTSRERFNLASDLLPPCDFIAFLVSGFVSSFVLSLFSTQAPALPAADQASIPLLFQSNLSLIAASLACFVLYDQSFATRAVQRSYGALARSFALRFSTTLLLLALIGNATQLLASASNAWLVGWLSGSFALTACARFAAARSVIRLQTRGALRESVAAVGAGPIAERLDRHLRQSKTQNVELIGIFDDEPALETDRLAQVSSMWPVRKLEELFELKASGRLDWVVITLPDSDEIRIRSLVERLRSLSVPIALCPQNIGLRLPIQDVDFTSIGLPLILVADRPIKRWNVILKSAEDLILSWLIVLLLSPLFALIALAIRLDSRGPIIFKQRRHTFNNQEFDIYKFRTMRCQESQDDRQSELQQTTRSDPRVTRIGRLLRETSLDELPQLINVLRGEMSLVGPRPHAINMKTQNRLGSEITDRYVHRHRVKPGMTGWSQVNGARGATDTIEQLQRRIDLDLHYIEHWSLWLDLKILLMTVRVVLKRTNAF